MSSPPILWTDAALETETRVSHLLSVTVQGNACPELRPFFASAHVYSDPQEPWKNVYATIRRIAFDCIDKKLLRPGMHDDYDVFVQSCMQHKHLPFLGPKANPSEPVRSSIVFYVSIWRKSDPSSPAHTFTDKLSRHPSKSLTVKATLDTGSDDEGSRRALPPFDVVLSTDQCVRAFRKNLGLQACKIARMPATTTVSISFLKPSSSHDSNRQSASQMFYSRVEKCLATGKPLEIKVRVSPSEDCGPLSGISVRLPATSSTRTIKVQKACPSGVYSVSGVQASGKSLASSSQVLDTLLSAPSTSSTATCLGSSSPPAGLASHAKPVAVAESNAKGNEVDAFSKSGQLSNASGVTAPAAASRNPRPSATLPPLRPDNSPSQSARNSIAGPFGAFMLAKATNADTSDFAGPAPMPSSLSPSTSSSGESQQPAEQSATSEDLAAKLYPFGYGGKPSVAAEIAEALVKLRAEKAKVHSRDGQESQSRSPPSASPQPSASPASDDTTTGHQAESQETDCPRAHRDWSREPPLHPSGGWGRGPPQAPYHHPGSWPRWVGLHPATGRHPFVPRPHAPHHRPPPGRWQPGGHGHGHGHGHSSHGHGHGHGHGPGHPHPRAHADASVPAPAFHPSPSFSFGSPAQGRVNLLNLLNTRGVDQASDETARAGAASSDGATTTKVNSTGSDDQATPQDTTRTTADGAEDAPGYEAARTTIKSMLSGFLVNLNRVLSENFGDDLGRVEVSGQAAESAGQDSKQASSTSTVSASSSGVSAQAKADESPKAARDTGAVEHPAWCDLCNKRIHGTRYKCVECPDWDCCSQCKPMTGREHPGHSFITAKEHGIIPAADKRTSLVTHKGVICDHCDVTIHGSRFKCIACPDFDLCDSCEAHPMQRHAETHGADHLFLKIDKPLIRDTGVLDKAVQAARKVTSAQSQKAPTSSTSAPVAVQTETSANAIVGGAASAAPVSVPAPPHAQPQPQSMPQSQSQAAASGRGTPGRRVKLAPVDRKVLHAITRGLVAAAMEDGQRPRRAQKHSDVDDDMEESERNRSRHSGSSSTGGPSDHANVAHTSSGKRIKKTKLASDGTMEADQMGLFPWDLIEEKLAQVACRTKEFMAKIDGIEPALRDEATASADASPIESNVAPAVKVDTEPKSPTKDAVKAEAREAKKEEKAKGKEKKPEPESGREKKEETKEEGTLTEANPRPPLPSSTAAKLEQSSRPKVWSNPHDAAFVRDVSLPDRSVVAAGSRFDKVWLVRNTGTEAWPRHVGLLALRQTGGDLLVAKRKVSLFAEVPYIESVGPSFDGSLVLPGQEVEVRVSQLLAPEKEGRVQSFWRLADLSQVCGPRSMTTFGEQLWVDVDVIDPNSFRATVSDRERPQEETKRKVKHDEQEQEQQEQQEQDKEQQQQQQQQQQKGSDELEMPVTGSLSGSSVFHAPSAPDAGRTEAKKVHAREERDTFAVEDTRDSARRRNRAGSLPATLVEILSPVTVTTEATGTTDEEGLLELALEDDEEEGSLIYSCDSGDELGGEFELLDVEGSGDEED